MKKSIVIVAHKFVTHPDDELVSYLNKKRYTNILHINHPFYEAPNRKSTYHWYKKGRLHKKVVSGDLRGYPELVIYFREFFLTVRWVLGTDLVWDWYVGMDGYCTLMGNTLRFFGKVKKTVLWAIDFVPHNRFESGWKNFIYRWVNTNSYRTSDEVWDLSPRMADARLKFHGIKKTDYKRRRIVPYGMWINKIRRYSYKKSQMHTAVFMGRLLENQGAQLIVAAIPQLLKKIPDFKLKIIGTGPYEKTLKELAIKLKVAEHCIFKGKISSHKIVEQEIAKSAVALAPYIKRLDKWTYYADPGKVKTYLACGVPVLLTNLPWNAKEIQIAKAGLIIKDDIPSLIRGAVKLMSPVNEAYRKKAIEYSRRFDYESIFSKLPL